MIPLRDIIPSRTTPWVTYSIFGANIAVFLYTIMLPERDFDRFVLHYGLTPAAFSWISALTSTFIHADILHVASNMLCLWIFGDNVEDRMGHGRFLVFYLLAGLAAALGQTYAGPDATLPLIGASGAIAGVMGAYFVLFPTARVLVLVFVIFFVNIIEVPAILFLGFWFVLQVLSGFGQYGHRSLQGGVAFWAHAAGFVAGVVGVWIFKRPERQRVDWWGR